MTAGCFTSVMTCARQGIYDGSVLHTEVVATAGAQCCACKDSRVLWVMGV